MCSNYTNNNGVILYLNIDKDLQVAVTSDKLFHHNNILGGNENLNELVYTCIGNFKMVRVVAS